MRKKNGPLRLAFTIHSQDTLSAFLSVPSRPSTPPPASPGGRGIGPSSTLFSYIKPGKTGDEQVTGHLIRGQARVSWWYGIRARCRRAGSSYRGGLKWSEAAGWCNELSCTIGQSFGSCTPLVTPCCLIMIDGFLRSYTCSLSLCVGNVHFS